MTVTEGNTGTSTATSRSASARASGQTVTVELRDGERHGDAPGRLRGRGRRRSRFAPGQVSRRRSPSTVHGDVLDEIDETFFVNLSNAVERDDRRRQALGTITDDDALPTLSIGDVTVTEGNTGHGRPRPSPSRLTAPSGAGVTVDYATANGTATRRPTTRPRAATPDLRPAGRSRSGHRPGQRRRARRDQRDVLRQPRERRSNADDRRRPAASARSPTTIRCRRSAIGDVTVTEGDCGTVDRDLHRQLSARSSGRAVTVNYATANGTAIAPARLRRRGAATLTFAPGQTTRTITVRSTATCSTRRRDVRRQPLERRSTRRSPTATGVGTITDDDPLPRSRSTTSRSPRATPARRRDLHRQPERAERREP